MRLGFRVQAGKVKLCSTRVLCCCKIWKFRRGLQGSKVNTSYGRVG